MGRHADFQRVVHYDYYKSRIDSELGEGAIYRETYSVFKKHGIVRTQESGYKSEKPISERKFLAVLDILNEKLGKKHKLFTVEKL